MSEYQLLDPNKTDCILRTSDNANIPPSPNNADYQEYLAWLEKGNTPDPVPQLASQS